MSGACGLEAVAGLEKKYEDEFVSLALDDEHLDYQIELAIEDGMRLESIPTPLLKMPEASIHEEYENAPRCRGCGTKIGFAFGTGDCGCEFEPDVGF